MPKPKGRPKGRQTDPPVSLQPLKAEDALAGLMQVKPEPESAPMSDKYVQNQRVHIKRGGGNPISAPPDSAKGKFGTLAQRYRAGHPSPGVPERTGQLWYVEVDGAVTELIGEDWLEPESC